MTWELFYLTCFALGLALCVLSLFAGGGHAHGGHFHFGSHAHVHVHGGPSGPGGNEVRAGISPINGFTLTAFLCWFGGAGYLLHKHSGLLAPLVLLVAGVSGLVGAGLIFWFLASVLLPHEKELTAEETDIVGTIGHVTDPLRSGSTGEILYSQLGVRRSAAARSENGTVIDRGVEVVVLRYEHGIAYVRRWDDLDL
jgi:hypothetical protein